MKENLLGLGYLYIASFWHYAMIASHSLDLIDLKVFEVWANKFLNSKGVLAVWSHQKKKNI